jgi:hypothetical protein
MITLNSGATNSVVLRLNDNVTISNPIFLFELESIQSREKFTFTAQDYSTNGRYNQFYIWEISGITASISLTASTPQILLEYGGFYNYKVIQKTNYGLTYSDADTILDIGKAVFYNGEYQNFFF